VSVTVNAPTKSGGGGGVLSAGLLLALAALLAAKLTFEHVKSGKSWP
jgi:hypothetical protein